ncbi:ion transporter [Mycobacterium sherrisii]|uniref:ion transporter n=1 Tax=Mycobacterium sherrisii TaxID=243061 RepID=UPI002DDD07D3|nr:ion transporter [Mycobacterium sherrisii]MEC4763801.1 ion transporter [Mycobacterium sherrisii]
MRAMRAVDFEHVVTGVIAANSVLLVWELAGGSEIAERLELLCLGFFVAELVVRFWRDPLGSLRNPWVAFDLVVIGLALLPIFGADTSLLRVARLSRAVHWLRHATHLRWARYLRPVARVVVASK